MDDFVLPRGEVDEQAVEAARSLAKLAATRQEVYEAGLDADRNPTEGQQEVGNYAKGRVSLNGLEIRIENPKGSMRSGTSPDGSTWSNQMAWDYGYVLRVSGETASYGADGDKVDVFIGPHPESELVHVINQVDPESGGFDEVKVMLGFLNKEEAKRGYLDNYDEDWQGLGSVVSTTMDQFKEWLKNGDTSKPFTSDCLKSAGAAGKCPGCGRDFPPGAEKCEGCERYGPSKSDSKINFGSTKEAEVRQLTDIPARETPGAYQIKESTVHGLGVHADRNLDLGDPIGFTAEKDGQDLLGRDTLVLTKFGRYMNYAGPGMEPNIFLEPEDGGYRAYAKDRIKAGHEILASPHYRDEHRTMGMPDRAVLINGTVPESEKHGMDQPAEGTEGTSLEDYVQFTAPFEGFREQVYTDTQGHPTVGYGTNLDAPGARQALDSVGLDYDQVRQGQASITRDQASQIMRAHLRHARQTAQRFDPRFSQRPEQFRRVLTDMAYNMGPSSLNEFEDMRAALQNDDWSSVAREMQDSDWYNQTGRRARHHVDLVRQLAGQSVPAQTQPQTQTHDMTQNRWPQQHTVEQGQALSGIADQYYDDPNAYDRIVDRNQIEDPDRIQAGQQLQIPAPAGTQPQTQPQTQTQTQTPQTMTLEQGQTVSDLAEQAYGDPNQYQPILERNQIEDPTSIQAGTDLEIPELGSEKGGADAAKGIPDRSQTGDEGQLSPGQLYDLIVQEHQADRAGLHDDLRIGDANTGLLSWALPKQMPGPGEKRLAKRQPVHRYSYRDFQGQIPQGYGRGQVRQKQRGRTLITDARPGEIRFTADTGKHPERFLLKRTDDKDNWLLINTTPQEALPHKKIRYKSIPADQVDSALDQLREGGSAQAKIDGASSLVKLLKDGVELVSYRAQKGTGRPIVHTERFFGKKPEAQIPKELQGTVLRGELYGEQADEDGSKSILSPQHLGGVLNSRLAESLRKQREQGIDLKNMVFDVQRLGDQEIDPQEVPYEQRRQMLDRVLPHLPGHEEGRFHPPEEAHGPDQARQLYEQITSGQHPLTEEGMVIHPPAGKPMKVKPREERDVYVTGTFPGEGRRAQTIGGLTYALEPGGETVGRVGTGFDEKALQDLAEQGDENLRGRVARVSAQEQLPSGALRAPSFLALHEDYPQAKTAGEWHCKVATDGHVPTLAVDLDSTLAQPYDEFQADHIPPPRVGARKWMRRFADEGVRLIIWTVRGDRKLVRDWLEQWEIPYDYVNHNPDQPEGTSQKVIADAYIGDDAVPAQLGRSWNQIGQQVLARLTRVTR
jgi:GH24 family phage-related lysozyme (muramidase)/LysM repeat protein